jgi:hypothetical protein
MADQLGLTDYAKEMARWNKPRLAKMAGVSMPPTTAGRVELQPPRIVTSGARARRAAAGWC